MDKEEYKRRYVAFMVEKGNYKEEAAQKDFDDCQEEYLANYPDDPELAAEEELKYWSDDEVQYE
jgi:hypothetical protein